MTFVELKNICKKQYRDFQYKLVLKPLQFLNHCMSRINRIKEQKLALPVSRTLDSYNGRQVILQTQQVSACLL